MATDEKQIPRPPKPRGWLIAVLLLLAVLAGGVYAATRMGYGSGSGDGKPPATAGTADDAARAGLETIRLLAREGEARAFGFASPDEAGQARLGTRIEVLVVPLDALKAYAGGPAAGLFQASPDSVYPVLVGDTVRSSVTVTRMGGGYQATSYGEGGLQAIAGGRALPDGSLLVRVPALGLQFVGTRANGTLMLAATAADPRLRLEAGQVMPAEQVLAQLVPIANAYNGEPM